MNPVRPSSSFSGAKSKKIKNKFRGQQQGQSSMNNVNSNSNQNDSFANEKDKGFPIKDYAGISSDSTRIYAEQTNYDQLSEDACNILTEDINYKLRHIIHDCLLKSKLQGRDTITANDVEEAFSNLNIDKVYGAPSSPNWLPFRDPQEITLFHLDDQRVNLIELAENECNWSQEGDTVLDQVWLPDGNDSDDDMVEERNETFTEYFETMCEAIISDDEEIRHMALTDISTNPSIGPITNWFYHFSYFLLIKDVTYDRLTMRALQLLEVLENSPLSSLHAYARQLKLVVRLLLQRLLISTAKEDIVKHMCYVLSLFCLRTPLRNLVLNKVEDKIASVWQEMSVPLLNIMFYIGIDAIKRIFLPNLRFFLVSVYEENDPNMTEIVLAIYGLLCKANLNKGIVYYLFNETFGEDIMPYYRPKYMKDAGYGKKEIDVVKMKKKLIKTRRKVDYRNKNMRGNVKKLEEIFKYTPHNCVTEISKIIDETIGSNQKEAAQGRVSFKIVGPCCSFREKLENHRQLFERTRTRRETQVTVGKTSLLLSVLKHDYSRKCSDHSLLTCWL